VQYGPQSGSFEERAGRGTSTKRFYGTCGWYIWAGEQLSEASDFFVPVHAAHLADWAPLVLPYLGLPPGWRFLVTEQYEDVWEDKQLLEDK